MFRSLEFLDLPLCHRVCNTWYTYLPGNEPTLCEELFIRSRETQPNRPILLLHIVVQDSLRSFSMSTQFMLRIEPIALSDPDDWHPMAKNLGQYPDIITGEGNPSKPYTLCTLDELERKTESLRERMRGKDGGWRDMLVCRPSTK